MDLASPAVSGTSVYANGLSVAAYRFKAEGHVAVFLGEIRYQTFLNVIIRPRESYVVTRPKIFVYWKHGVFFLLWRCDPTQVMASKFLMFSRSHTTTHHIRQDSSGRVISSSQRPLPDNAHHSQQTNIHASGGIRTPDLSRRAAAYLRLRPRGHWDRLQAWGC